MLSTNLPQSQTEQEEQTEVTVESLQYYILQETWMLLHDSTDAIVTVQYNP